VKRGTTAKKVLKKRSRAGEVGCYGVQGNRDQNVKIKRKDLTVKVVDDRCLGTIRRTGRRYVSGEGGSCREWWGPWGGVLSASRGSLPPEE